MNHFYDNISIWQPICVLFWPNFTKSVKSFAQQTKDYFQEFENIYFMQKKSLLGKISYFDSLNDTKTFFEHALGKNWLDFEVNFRKGGKGGKVKEGQKIKFSIKN